MPYKPLILGPNQALTPNIRLQTQSCKPGGQYKEPANTKRRQNPRFQEISLILTETLRILLHEPRNKDTTS